MVEGWVGGLAGAHCASVGGMRLPREPSSFMAYEDMAGSLEEDGGKGMRALELSQKKRWEEGPNEAWPFRTILTKSGKRQGSTCFPLICQRHIHFIRAVQRMGILAWPST